jgi:tetraacyldisaccharide 4'-kinase
VPVLIGHLEPLPTGLPLDGLPVLAFAGIGHPEKFFATLREMGADLRAEHALSDHQPLSDTLMTRMLREARHRCAGRHDREGRGAPVARVQVARSDRARAAGRIDDWAPLDAAIDRLFEDS